MMNIVNNQLILIKIVLLFKIGKLIKQKDKYKI